MWCVCNVHSDIYRFHLSFNVRKSIPDWKNETLNKRWMWYESLSFFTGIASTKRVRFLIINWFTRCLWDLPFMLYACRDCNQNPFILYINLLYFLCISEAEDHLEWNWYTHFVRVETKQMYTWKLHASFSCLPAYFTSWII